VPTRNVVLTDSQARLVQELVASGRYQNASEVIREGLRLIERREAEDAAKLEVLRGAAVLGIRDLERGAFKEFADAPAFEAHLNRASDELLNAQAHRR